MRITLSYSVARLAQLQAHLLGTRIVLVQVGVCMNRFRPRLTDCKGSPGVDFLVRLCMGPKGFFIASLRENTSSKNPRKRYTKAYFHDLLF